MRRLEKRDDNWIRDAASVVDAGDKYQDGWLRIEAVMIDLHRRIGAFIDRDRVASECHEST